ncbi:MAG: 30S ribosomal protein THX [Flavobacteriales bacterium]|nr:30S ribosomal protein THX [Flavobacteriales bacterium]
MGKGDIKTTKGKRTRGSYGNTRKRKKTVKIVAAKPKKKAAPKKATAKKPTAKKAAPKAKKEEKS